ncbi:asparagine synthase [Saccharothrix violaceirubra]|uniref:Asparagine synthase (Glutamine-hydrolyzing) n=1 Tax=Saccharothrix violaceirubra TaxID=413306 RepID=A0A7W7TAJ7_9PSEU|nr:asparagine synthase C-terminal domain-containing protein [Saccharothrix violaceirubra]MBB4969072.1 asparagine synthase (glutamine-hydrolyzing) [Saccharothrix violaceirubra]
MLKLCLRMPPGAEWRWNGEHWSDGVSTIRPYAHPMLEHAAVTDGVSTFVVVRERARQVAGFGAADVFTTADTPTYLRLLDEIKAWPLDFVLIECTPPDGYRITSGTWGTAPLYLTDAGERLRGSWSLPDLRQQFSLDALDERSVARLLTERTRYARETLFRGVYMLTERAHATYGDDGLVMHYPAPAEHASPREIRHDVDVVEVYRRVLSDAVYARPFEPQTAAVELSGGMDSASVAVALAEQHRGEVLSYALAIGGEAGEQQLRRRAEMLLYLGFPDLTVDALPLAPLNPDGARARGLFVEPGAEPYHEAVGTILAAARGQGVRTVFTGDGGDELLSLRGDEWASVGKVRGRFSDHERLPPWLGRRTADQLDAVDDDLAPPTVINEATLLGFALRSPQFLDAGIWPVSPLCSPRLIRFAEQLPVSWRVDKHICRERFHRIGFSHDARYPHLRENFRHVMGAGLREYGMPLLAELLAEAVTVDLGFVDGDALRAALERWKHGEQVDMKVFPVLSLELALRAMTAHRGEREGALCT